MKQLGKLESVELRDYWANEAGDFTPWLAEEVNLKLLGDTIGIELELEAQEQSVGPFSADILCKDTSNGNWVLIENQLEKTDHKHLGQLLTYSAGLKAVTIVWIAKPFVDEHRAALDWLNEITDDRFNFFGIEIELWKIGGSPAAPKFNIVSKPNNWSKAMAKARTAVDNENLSEGKDLQLRFWQGFVDYCDTRTNRFRTQKAQPQHWMNIAIGKSGIHLAAIASLYNNDQETYDVQELRVILSFISPRSKDQFNQMQSQKDAIENELGFPLEWSSKEGRTQCTASVRRDAMLKVEENWPAYFEWLATNLDKFDQVFRERVKKLK